MKEQLPYPYYQQSCPDWGYNLKDTLNHMLTQEELNELLIELFEMW